MKKLGLLLLSVLVLVSCAPAPTPDLKATETAITYNILATLTAQVPILTTTPVATDTPKPTMPKSTATLVATDTPAVIIKPTATPEPTTTPTPVIYVVKAGDTLSAIAKLHGITVEALQEANAISDPRLLQIGQELIIPKGGAVVPKVTATEVKPTSTQVQPKPTPTPARVQAQVVRVIDGDTIEVSIRDALSKFATSGLTRQRQSILRSQWNGWGKKRQPKMSSL